MCLVSIIIPVYNTGEILRSTLDSVLHQTYTNIEIVLVDDGSTDSSGMICLEYVANDSRFKYFKKENGGICSARNYGLIKCHGKYVYFSDHDDIMDEFLIEKSIERIKSSNAELVKFGVYLYDEVNKKKSTRCFKDNYDLNLHELSYRIIDDINNEFYSNIWDCLYKRDFLIDNNLFFDTTYKKGYEDIDFNFRMLEKINKVSYTTDVLYSHYIRKGTSTSSKAHHVILECLLNNPQRINRLINIIPTIKNNPEGLCYYYIHNFIISSISYSKRLGIEKKEIVEKLSKERHYIFDNLSNVSIIKLGNYSFRIGGPKYLLFPLFYILLKLNKESLIYSLIK